MEFSAYPTIKERIQWISRDEKLYCEILKASEGLYIPKYNQKLLRNKLNFLGRRKKILTSRNIFKVVIFVMMNFEYYPTFRNAMSDIYATIFLR